MLLLEQVSLGYQNKKEIKMVIQDLTLAVEDGHCLAVLGSSGCGKSTLINGLAGLIPFVSGGAFLEMNGQKQPLSPKVHKIGIIPQGSGLLPWKTVLENCLLPLKIRKERKGAPYRRELEEICQALHIEDLMERYPGELSGGQAQRVAIARAFLLRPDLLLMDEPFSSLDAITAEEAKKLYLSLWKQYRATVLFVTHNIEEALYLGNRIAVLDQEKGTIKYLEENPYQGKKLREEGDLYEAKEILRQQLQ